MLDQTPDDFVEISPKIINKKDIRQMKYQTQDQIPRILSDNLKKSDIKIS